MKPALAPMGTYFGVCMKIEWRLVQRSFWWFPISQRWAKTQLNAILLSVSGSVKKDHWVGQCEVLWWLGSQAMLHPRIWCVSQTPWIRLKMCCWMASHPSWKILTGSLTDPCCHMIIWFCWHTPHSVPFPYTWESTTNMMCNTKITKRVHLFMLHSSPP